MYVPEIEHFYSDFLVSRHRCQLDVVRKLTQRFFIIESGLVGKELTVYQVLTRSTLHFVQTSKCNHKNEGTKATIRHNQQTLSAD